MALLCPREAGRKGLPKAEFQARQVEGATGGCHPGNAGGTSGCCLPLILGSEQADSAGIKEKPRGWGPGRPGSSSSHLAPMEMKGQGRCQSLPGL